MRRELRVAAVDLGATSGRVMAAEVGPDVLRLEEVHRFPNGGVPVRGSLLWDVVGIHREVVAGLRKVALAGRLDMSPAIGSGTRARTSLPSAAA